MNEPSRLVQIVRELYPRGWPRCRAELRLGVCPFEALLEQVPPGATVLDVGCGSGLFLTLLASTGRIERGVGFDPSPRAIEIAREIAAHLPRGQVTFEQRSVEADWPEDSFDTVSMIDVLHHVRPPVQRKAVEKALLSVGARGQFLYKDMCTRPRWRALANRAHDLLAAREWIHERPFDEVTRWVCEAGWSRTHAARIDRLVYGHDLGVFRRAAETGTESDTESDTSR